MENYDLVINNGLVINSDVSQIVNVGIKDGKVTALSQESMCGNRVIDASNNWVLPGVIDTHVHFNLKQGQGEDAISSDDDYQNGPIASAIGGVTTFIDYAIAPRNRSPIDFLNERIEQASSGSCIDFSFHAGITNPDPEVLKEFPKIIEMGIPSFKFFVNYKAWGFAVDLGFLYDAMTVLNENNGVVCIHCEHDEILSYLRQKYINKPELIYHSRSRPDFAEEIAIAELLILARETSCRLYIVHLSTEKGLNRIKEAKANGLRVRTETCPHYLEFNHDVYNEPRGILYTMTPPLRAPGNKEALDEGLISGLIDILSSDHNAFGLSAKESHPSWLSVPPGIAGSEILLTYTHNHLVATKMISPERMVELLSANPAETFGLRRKGKIQIGYDADVVIFDPTQTKTLTHTDLATPSGFSIFEGMSMTGWPTSTIANGKVIVENRNFIGQRGQGRFIERTIDTKVW